MFKYTCFIVYVVSLSCVCAVEGVRSAIEFDLLKKDCLRESGTTEADLMNGGDMTKINPCYYGCYFKKIGLLTDKGQYDPTIYLRDLKEILKDNDFAYAKLEEQTVKCESVKNEAVSDGEAGCELGALVAACIFRQESYFTSLSNVQN